MKIFAWIRSFKLYFQAKTDRWGSSLSRPRNIFLFTLAFCLWVQVYISSSWVYARIPEAAVIQTITFGSGNRNMFKLAPSEDISLQPIEDFSDDERRVGNGGELWVPNDGESLASFYFEQGSEDSSEHAYGGLVVQTMPIYRTDLSTTKYEYPCRFRGRWIIAWQGNSENGACDNEQDGGVEIIQDPRNYLSLNTSSNALLDKSLSSLQKQDIPDENLKNLSIAPGTEATVIRTRSRQYFEPVEVGEECNLTRITYSCRYVNGERVCEEYERRENCQPATVYQQMELAVVEVLEGDILVKTGKNPLGVKVVEGQIYSYPEEALRSFDVGQAALSCETLKLLNPSYWIDANIPLQVSDGIAQQLKEHKEALGVSGRPPDNLSDLERALVVELNNIRSNPIAYAALLEQRKQFYYDNWLKLPGESLDLDVRKQAVNEAINFLRRQPNLAELTVSTGLSMSSRDHVVEQGRTGRNFGHMGDNGDGYWDRIKRHGTAAPCGINENISYFDPSLAQDVRSEVQVALAELLIEDGQRQAGSRDNIFNKDFQVIGVACGPHGPFLRKMCDITYAAGYLEGV